MTRARSTAIYARPVRRLTLWLRTLPAVGDRILMAALALVDLTEPFLGDFTGRGVGPIEYLAVTTLLLAPLVFRRRFPIAVAYAILGGLLLLVATRPAPVWRASELAAGIAVYTLVTRTDRRQAALYTGFVFALLAFWVLARAPVTDELRATSLFYLLFYAVVLALCWVFGELVGTRRAYATEVELRLRGAELEQDQLARVAVAEERNRIARELHDVLVHLVSAVVAQADGATYALRGEPDLAEQALRTISEIGREVLTELRGLLEVLRTPDDPGEPALQQPGLDGLVRRCRHLGLPVGFELHGRLDDLPTGLRLGVHRIIEESLTNVRKHAGPTAKATVDVRNDGKRVEIDVRDDGAPHQPSPVRSDGRGLVGMRERAAVYGGTLEAGPGSGGGWRVHAILPFPRTGSAA